MSWVNPSAHPSGSDAIAGGRSAPSGVPGCSTTRSNRTPGGKSSAVSNVAFSRAPGHVGVPSTAQPDSDTTVATAMTTALDAAPILEGYSATLEVRGYDGARRRTAGEQIRHRVEVEVRGEQVGHRVELGVTPAGDVDVVGDDEPVPVRRRGGVGEPTAPHVVVVEQAVPVRAVHRATPDADVEPRVLGRPCHLAVVNLVPA